MDARGIDTVEGEARRFGTGDVLMYVGGGIGVLFVLLLLVRYLGQFSFDWLAGSLLVLLCVCIGSVVAAILSLSSEKWLLIPYGWCALVTAMLIGEVTTLGGAAQAVAPGADFFILLGALLMGGGAYMVRKRIGLWPERVAGGPADPDVQLEKLKEMYDKELITEDDYNRKRQEIMGKL